MANGGLIYALCLTFLSTNCDHIKHNGDGPPKDKAKHSSLYMFISFSSLSYDRSKASSKASSPHIAIQSFLFQMRVSSPFLKVIQ